ncbi:MAG: hypothetical protein H6733_08370 [Alphaproteobacteria bacterium]|nr:hypothetical protein [Alphaproteobacteria bacterium]
MPSSKELAERLADGVVFVLVEPQHPGNVGAAARALANMGLWRLVIVDPSPAFDVERARWMSPGADDVLARMRIVATLDEALEGVHRAVATTARHRRHAQTVHEPGDVADQVLDGPDDHVTAILFGREDTGLSREHTLRCESLLRIPTADHASLNLGQAVLLTAHHVFEAGRRRGLVAPGRVVVGRHHKRSTSTLDNRRASPLADLGDVEHAVVEATALLNRIGYGKATSPERVGVTLREALQRAHLTERQVRALRGMLGRVEYALDHPEIDWRASRRQQEARRGVPPVDDAPEVDAPGDDDDA